MFDGASRARGVGAAAANTDDDGARPFAFVHVDLDALWAVRRVYGDEDAAPAEHDPVYDSGLPALLSLFATHRVPASFFAVGMDAALAAPARRLAEARQAGHAIENHSWSHHLALSDLDDAALEAEVRRAHDAIGAAVGDHPHGFRAPGYDASARLLRLLARLGYRFDSSVLPTWAGPLLRVADAWLRLGLPRRRQYGPMAAYRAPLTPYTPDPARSPYLAARDAHLDAPMELPVLVSPGWRLPVHAGFVFLRGLPALRKALENMARRPGPIVFLIHGVDAIDTSGARHPVPGGRGRRFFAMPVAEKLVALDAMLTLLREYRTPIATRDWLATR